MNYTKPVYLLQWLQPCGCNVPQTRRQSPRGSSRRDAVGDAVLVRVMVCEVVVTVGINILTYLHVFSSWLSNFGENATLDFGSALEGQDAY